MLTVNVNATKLISWIQGHRQRFSEVALPALRKGMAYYEGHVVKSQMTVRKMPDYGLNRQTGTLARSGRIQGQNPVLLQFGEPLAHYGVYHQIGKQAGNKITSPKRLYVTEEFPRWGHKYIWDSITTAVYKEFKKK